MSRQGVGFFINKLSKQTNAKLTKSNSTKNFYSLQSLIVRKLNQKEKSSDIIKNEIYEYLNFPDKFLSPNSRVTIGKKIKLKDMKFIGIEPVIQKKIQTPSKRMSLYRKSYNFNNNNINNNNSNNAESNMRNSIASTHLMFKEKQQAPNNDKLEVIDNEQLKKIFNKYKTFQINSKNDEKKNNFIKSNIKNKSEIFTINNSSLTNKKKNRGRNNDIPMELAECLTFQNNKLKIDQYYDNKIKKISNHLSKLLKKNENELLINRVDDYSFKKELLKEIDFNKPIEDKYGIYKWNISLRRPKNFEGMRNSYINLTRDQNPFWGIVVEKFPRLKEMKIRPGILNKNKNFFDKFKKAHAPLISLKDYKNYENLNSLYVKGKNLFNIEYNREINNNSNIGKKLLYKTFVDKSGKVFLKTEINNIFGELTFCKNYSSSNLLNNNHTNFSSQDITYNSFNSNLPFQMKNNNNNFFSNSPSEINGEIYKKSSFYKNKSSPL